MILRRVLAPVPNAPVNDADVIVIGAGAAGLAATRSLLAAGCRVALLEARDRIGGRAWTEPWHGMAFDHGASFIHAEQLNPWTRVARRLRIATTVDPRRRLLFIGARQASEQELAALVAARGQAQRQVVEAAQAGGAVSIAEAVHGSGPWAAQAQVALGPWLLGAENAAADAADFAAGVSGRDRLVATGYGRLVAAYGCGVPVTLSAAVRRIDYRGQGVVVETATGRLRGRLAIATLPTGVLAAGRVRFEPALPLEKQHAIDALPMGLLTKVALRFEGDPFGLGDTFYLHRKTADQRAALYMMRPCGQNLALAFVGGDLARALEHAGEAAAGAFALEPLLEIFGSGLKSRLRGVRQTRWGIDPLALGSYAVARPGAAAMRAVLARPLADRLLFAGEACAADGWAATVAGAHESGRRAARKALALLGRRPRHESDCNAAQNNP
jgi:monoamine oxidase